MELLHKRNLQIIRRHKRKETRNIEQRRNMTRIGAELLLR